jgi:hypothetical protein
LQPWTQIRIGNHICCRAIRLILLVFFPFFIGHFCRATSICKTSFRPMRKTWSWSFKSVVIWNFPTYCKGKSVRVQALFHFLFFISLKILHFLIWFFCKSLKNNKRNGTKIVRNFFVQFQISNNLKFKKILKYIYT